MKVASFVVAALLAAPAFAACPTVSFTRTAVPVSSISGAFVGSAPDFNGDGRSDLAVFYNNTGGLQPFLSNGDGTFTPGALYGKLDIAVGHIGEGVYIVQNDGSRNFHVAQHLVPSGAAYYLELGDFNSDGLQDILMSEYGGWNILYSQPNGTFSAPQFISAPELSSGPFASGATSGGDFRGDGRADFATRLSSSTIDIFLNTCVPAPVITSVTPSFGPAAGGIAVQIHGSSLLTTTSVTFGNTGRDHPRHCTGRQRRRHARRRLQHRRYASDHGRVQRHTGIRPEFGQR